jgi:hypothetical protein
MKRTALVLVVFAVVFATLSVGSYTQKSATWDEPQHLVRGCLGWRGDHRMDPEHPPLLRLWAALPAAFNKDLRLDTAVIDRISPADWVGLRQFEYAQDSLYRQNDADRWLYRGRFMIVLLGVLLGVLVFSWANEWLGFWPAVAALTLYCFEPNLVAHASLVTTDFGAACFMFGALYFLWRFSRCEARAVSAPQRSKPAAGKGAASIGQTGGRALNAGAAIFFFALAMASKFTAVLLAPVVVALLAIDSWRKPNRGRAFAVSAGIVAGMFAAAWVTLWAVYGFRYAPSANPDWLFHFERGSPFGNRFPAFARLAVWADQHRLLPNACAQGFLLGQIKAQTRGAYLFGELSKTGWWYYFPVAFLIKTPVAFLAFVAGGLALVVARGRRFLETPVYLLLPVIVIVGVAMTQRLNIGLRHILPVYPLLLMVGAAAVEGLLRRGRRFIAVAGLVLMAGEFAVVYPSPLAFFNALVGGPAHGDECLVDSNLDWGQDLKGLKRWMDAHGVSHINLCYFGTAEPAYYGMNCTQLPGSGILASGSPPQLPGLVAISVTNLRGVYYPEPLREFYRPLLSMRPVARIGYSIFVYRVDRPWW